MKILLTNDDGIHAPGLMALVAERRFTKEEILENYLNEIYLGQNGLQGIFGVWEASRFYFARRPEELSITEIALLAGLIRAPNRYSPYRDPLVAQGRRDVVLRLMRNAQDITPEQYAAAVAEPVRIAEIHGQRNAAPYFVDFLRQELGQHYPPEVLTSEGLKIFTSLDVQLQRLAEAAVRDGLEMLQTAFSEYCPVLEVEIERKKNQGDQIRENETDNRFKSKVLIIFFCISLCHGVLIQP